MSDRCVLLLCFYLSNKYRIHIFHFSPIWSDIYQMESCTYCIFCIMCNFILIEKKKEIKVTT